ncbi:MAG TPA: hypothetical protein VJK04_03640 [Candidatus Paceibacterota bacterium]
MTSYLKHSPFFFLVAFIVLFLLPVVSLAAPYTYTITTSIPGTDIVAGDSANPSIANYIAAIYRGALALVGFVAFVMIVYWGFVYTLSAGNTSKTADARDGITQALLGLLLLLGGYLILEFVNPALVNIEEINYAPNYIRTGQGGGGGYGGSIIGKNVGTSCNSSSECKSGICNTTCKAKTDGGIYDDCDNVNIFCGGAGLECSSDKRCVPSLN